MCPASIFACDSYSSKVWFFFEAVRRIRVAASALAGLYLMMCCFLAWVVIGWSSGLTSRCFIMCWLLRLEWRRKGRETGDGSQICFRTYLYSSCYSWFYIFSFSFLFVTFHWQNFPFFPSSLAIEYFDFGQSSALSLAPPLTEDSSSAHQLHWVSCCMACRFAPIDGLEFWIRQWNIVGTIYQPSPQLFMQWIWQNRCLYRTHQSFVNIEAVGNLAGKERLGLEKEYDAVLTIHINYHSGPRQLWLLALSWSVLSFDYEH